MKKRIIFILLALIMLGTICYFYVNNILLPVKIKKYAQEKSQEFLQRKVTIENIRFKFPKGFILENITLYEKKKDDQAFVHIRQASFHVLLAPFLKTKNIIIPTIQIDDPVIRIVRDKNNQWNFSDLLNLKKPPQSKNNYKLLLSKLLITNGQVEYRDQTPRDEFIENFENINLIFKLAMDKGVLFDLTTTIPQAKASLNAKGHYDILSNTFSSDITFENVNFARYAVLSQSLQNSPVEEGVFSAQKLNIRYQNHILKINGGFTSKNTTFNINKHKKIKGDIVVMDSTITWDREKLNIQGRALMPAGRLILGPGQELRADMATHIKSLVITGTEIKMQSDLTLNKAQLLIGKNKIFKGNFESFGTSLSLVNGEMDLQGSLRVRDADFKFNEGQAAKGNLTTSETKISYKDKKWDFQTNLKISNANIKSGAHELINATILSDNIHLMYQNKIVDINAHGKIQEAAIKFNNQQLYQGDPGITLTFNYDPQKPKPITYQLAVVFTQSVILNIPYLKEVSNIQGKVLFAPDTVAIEGVTLNTQNTFIRLSGLVENLKNPKLDIKASSESVDLERLTTLFPEVMKKAKLQIKGQTAIEAAYKGALSSPSDADIKVTFQLQNTSVNGEILPSPITMISGQLDYSKDLLNWKTLQGEYQGVTYTLNGSLSNFARPSLTTNITSENLNLTTEIKIFHPYLDVLSAKGKYFNTSFDVSGAVRFPKEKDTVFDFKGPVQFNLEDLSAIAPKLKNVLGQWDPKGVLTTEELIFRGNLKDWKDWLLVFNAQSPIVVVKDTPLHNFNIHFAFRDRHVNQCNISAKLYNGDLILNSTADIKENDFPIDLAIQLTNLDLAQMRQDRKMKNKTLAGTLALNMNLTGPLNRLNDLEGSGAFQITDGHIWRLKVIEGLSKAFLIVEFQDTVFTDARANFTIKNRKISTENAKLLGRSIDLDGKGWIDFSKNINFDVSPQFSEITIIKSESLKKGPTSLISQAIKVKITGTIDKPAYKVESLPLKILKDTTGIITEGIGEILEGIFK